VFQNRSAVEIIVLVLTCTVSLALLLFGGALAVIALVHPETDISRAVESMISVISGIVGALLGLLAGRTEGAKVLEVRPDGSNSTTRPTPPS
jgi:uncharacterized sodium:solute symporter family permease YidK